MAGQARVRKNAYAFAMRSDRAAELGVTSLTDLAAVAPQLTVGGDPEFFERPEWIAVRGAYGVAVRGNAQFCTDLHVQRACLRGRPT